MKRQRPTLAVEEAANFIVPLVTSVAGLFLTVEVAVSKVLAVKYVPPYSKQTRPNGFENMRLCGLVKNVMADAFREFLREFWPEAFCMIALRDKRVRIESKKGDEEEQLVNDCNDRSNHPSRQKASCEVRCQT